MRKSFYALIVLITILMLICIFTNTFSLFETSGIAITEVSAGKWVIKVNDVDITGSNSQFTIDNFNYSANSNVVGDKIAPGRSGYADIVIDPTGTDVSIKYDIIFDFDNSDLGGSVSASVEDLTGGSVVRTGENTYSGIIRLSDIQNETTNTLRVNLNWVNEETNNDSDTALGTVYNNSITIPITVNVIQYTGETLVSYE